MRPLPAKTSFTSRQGSHVRGRKKGVSARQIQAITRANRHPAQDPLNLSARNVEQFDHVAKDLAVESAEERAAREVGGNAAVRLTQYRCYLTQNCTSAHAASVHVCCRGSQARLPGMQPPPLRSRPPGLVFARSMTTPSASFLLWARRRRPVRLRPGAAGARRRRSASWPRPRRGRPATRRAQLQRPRIAPTPAQTPDCGETWSRDEQ